MMSNLLTFENINKIKSVVGTSLMIMGSVAGGFTIVVNNMVESQQIRAQYMGNLLAYTQVVKQKSKLITDPKDIKNVDLKGLLEACNSKDFNDFYLIYTSQYDQNEFKNSCSLIKTELMTRSSEAF